MKSRALKEREIDVLTVYKWNVFYSLIFTFFRGIRIFLWVHNYSLVSYLVNIYIYIYIFYFLFFIFILFKITLVVKFPPWNYNPDMC